MLNVCKRWVGPVCFKKIDTHATKTSPYVSILQLIMIQIEAHHERICNNWKPSQCVAEEVWYIFSWIIVCNYLINFLFSDRNHPLLCVTKLIRMFICPIRCCARWQNCVVVLSSGEIVVSLCKLCKLFLHEWDPGVEKQEAVAVQYHQHGSGIGWIVNHNETPLTDPIHCQGRTSLPP